jgi:hypothetical protein
MIANSGITRRVIRRNVESPFHPMVLSGMKWLPTVAAILLVGACLCVPASAQQPQQSAAAQQAPATGGQTTVSGEAQPATFQAPAKTAPSGMNQDIQVSGYWKIDIRNPDGSLVKHVEFENSLTSNALNFTLQGALFGFNGANQIGVDAPFIGVNSGASQQNSDTEYFPFNGNKESSPCGGNNGCLIAKSNSAAYYQCQYIALVGPSNGYNAPSCFNGLSMSYGGSSDSSTILSGSFIAPLAGSINDVWSYITFCMPGYLIIANPVPCPLPINTPPPSTTSAPVASQDLDLTSYTLPTPIQVGQGQSVNVQVMFTFSSPAATSSNGAQTTKSISDPRRP